MSSNILNVFENAQFDDVITKKEYHAYLPYLTTSYSNNDEIRIPILSQDIYTLPCESFIYLEGKFDPKPGGEAEASHLMNNSYAFLFDEIRFSLNGIEIDKVRDIGITSCIKNLVSLTHGNARAIESAGWKLGGHPTTWDQTSKVFTACVPLKLWLGFAEMYTKILVNCKQELVLLRSRHDENTYIGKQGSISLEKVEWHVPHINVNDETKLRFWKAMQIDRPIQIAFRQWDLHELPSVNQNTSDKWAIRTSTQLEKPRYIILAFQTKKKNVKEADASNFDHIDLRNFKVFLNGESFPYEKQSLQFSNNKYGKVYHEYVNFQRSYYEKKDSDPLLNFENFKNHAIFVVDCSKQIESVVGGTVDVQIEYETNTPVPADTVGYCLIIHDCLVEYNPVSGIVHKIW